MNHAAYVAILKRLGVEPDTPAPSFAADPIARRVAAFRLQLNEWTGAGRLGVPVLALPGVVARESTCIGCGELLTTGNSWRCVPCVDAVYAVLGIPR